MPSITYDCHTHTTYSDGWDWKEMVTAAESVGLKGIALTDHCPIGPDPYGRRERYDFEETYQERREEIASDGEAYDIDILDGAEVNYDPTKEDQIRSFLETASFDLTIGSVHYADEYYVAHPDEALEEALESKRRAVIETYVEWQIELIASDLFDVIGHLDIVQRSPILRGLMTEEDYRRIAQALEGARTVPELNAGRLDRSYGTIHPHPDFLHVFAEHDIPFVVGSDSHAPDQLTQRLEMLSKDVPLECIDICQGPPPFRE